MTTTELTQVSTEATDNIDIMVAQYDSLDLIADMPRIDYN